MEIGNKIKNLRTKAGLTQEQLAARLGISAQSVSKWENAVTMPDITLLPMLAGELGVTIDELFDLTADQKLRRIERAIEAKHDFSADIFGEYEEYLKNQLEENEDKPRILSLLAHLYHRRMESDAGKVSRYAREAIMLKPEKKDCQWLLQMAEGQCAWDWNVENHAELIRFYTDVIHHDTVTPKTPLPYYYLIDNLIADHRTKEAAHWLEICSTLPAHRPFLIPVYRAHIALAEYREADADAIMEDAAREFADDDGFAFEAAQYYARKCEYEKAIDYYERSWTLEENSKPRYTDALEGIAVIYEIMNDGMKAAETYDRIIRCLKEEWGYAPDDSVVVDIERKKSRIVYR